MIALVRIALRRPYTFVVLALLLLIIGPLAALRTPTDIFPEIRIPVIGVVWQYTGLPPDEMAGRIVTPFQRALTTTVNDIEHIEANSYNGIGIVKIFFQPSVDIRTANAQVTAISQTMLRQMPPGTTPPLILNYNASTVPILQLALSGEGLTEQNLVRPRPQPWCARRSSPCRARRSPIRTAARRGRCRSISIRRRCRRVACPAQDVANALAAQNLITPVGTQKIGSFEYTIQLNNAPSAIEDARRPADQDRQRRDGLHPRRRARARRQSAADQHRPCRRQPLGADVGAEERRDLDAGDHRRHQAEGRWTIKDRRCPSALKIALDRRSVDVRPRRHQRRRA